VHLDGQDRTYGVKGVVAVQPLGHEPGERCPDGELITHGDLVLDNGVDEGVQARIWKWDAVRGMVRLDEIRALEVGK